MAKSGDAGTAGQSDRPPDEVEHALAVALAGVRLDARVGDARMLPVELLDAIQRFVDLLKSERLPPERVVMRFKDLLTRAAPGGHLYGAVVNRAIITAAINCYFGREERTLFGDRVAAAPTPPGGTLSARELPPVLVVDDDADSRVILGTMLQSDGYETLIAANGADALVIASRTKPGIVLLDLMMPRMGGTEVLVEMRRIPHMREIPVIAVTAYPDVVESPELLASGFADVLIKPVRRSTLLHAVADRINR
jgi:CheY-like chemotaxis protein